MLSFIHQVKFWPLKADAVQLNGKTKDTSTFWYSSPENQFLVKSHSLITYNLAVAEEMSNDRGSKSLRSRGR